MKKIDRRKSYYVMLDVETCPLDRDFEGVSPDNMWVYDIGFAIIDKHDNVYEQRSYIIRDIFFKEKELMQSAYYANKIPMYLDDIRSGARVVKTFYEVRKELAELMAEYDTKIVIAHNARFDDVALKNTQRWLTKSKYRSFLPYGTVVWDTLKMAQDTLGNQPSYRRWCENNGYMTSHRVPRPRMTAEIIYRYISGIDDFVENHTGLEDVMIEKTIFAYCMRQHKPMRKELYA